MMPAQMSPLLQQRQGPWVVFRTHQRNELLGTWRPGDLGSIETLTLPRKASLLEKSGVKIPDLYRKTNRVMAPAFHVWLFSPVNFLLVCGFGTKSMTNYVLLPHSVSPNHER